MAGINSAQIRDRAQQQGINLSDDQVQQILKSAWDQSQYGADEGRVMQMLQSYSSNGSQVTNESANSPEALIQSISDEIAKSMEVYTKRGEEFDAKNPFNFDEMQARSSAEQAFNPYYSAELNDFVKGIDMKRKSTEGERDLLSELNRTAAGAERRNLDEAIRQSEEGYAGSGLFFSGARERGTGMAEIGGAEKARSRESQFKFGQEELGRNLQGLNTSEATGRRQISAEQTTNIESRIANLKAEESARHETERAQYIGYPGTSLTGGFNQLLQGAFQY